MSSVGHKSTKIILSNHQAAGDVLMLTAVIRDLHFCHPGKFTTDVRTSCPELWRNNPWITPLQSNDPNVEEIICRYPLIEQCDSRPVHFLQGFTDFVGERLGVRLPPMRFKGDIHLSERERRQPSPVKKFGIDGPYWLIVAGGKRDYTIKWWSSQRFQHVVDSFDGKITFVQVGARDDVHPALSNVLDMRGKTSIRDLIRLVYHSSGVLCPVTFLMHLSAAVEAHESLPSSRPCVVIAGGREAPHWEAYPTHQFIHTVGSLDCCREGGCWRSRTTPLGDGDIKDRPENLCVDVVDSLPRCMDMITADAVVERMKYYLR